MQQGITPQSGDEETAGAPVLARMLAATRRTTRLSMAFERIWPLVLVPVAVIALFATLSWFGVFRVLETPLRLALGGMFLLAFGASLLLARRFAAPLDRQVDRRLETVNTLAHRPVAAQSDRLAQGNGDPFAEALWAHEKARLAGTLGRL